MKSGIVIFCILFCFQSCKPRTERKAAVYYWLGFESIVKDSTGKLSKPVQWGNSHHIGVSGDTFFIYSQNDSILMKMPHNAKGNMFRKLALTESRWKPAGQYSNEFFFVGNYTAENMPGFYVSYYATKDYSSLLQLHYTNPGNLVAALVFSKDSVNLLQKKNVLIDPGKETQYPEELRLKN